MIYVDRSRVAGPGGSWRDKAEEALDRVETLRREIGPLDRSQRRWAFMPELYDETREPLTRLFHGKCAYCETDLADIDLDNVSQYRPKVEALGLDDVSDPHHYYWLAFEWENLYLVCAGCDRNKRNRFPVVGARAEPGALGPDLAKEKALLLDPCGDRPERHLEFSEDGQVRGVPPPDPGERQRYGGFNRGQLTVDIVGLNRGELIKRRADAIQATLAVWDTLLKPGTDPDARQRALDRLRERLEVHQPFAGAQRQAVARRTDATLNDPDLDQGTRELLAPLAELLRRELEALAPAPEAAAPEVAAPKVPKPKPKTLAAPAEEVAPEPVVPEAKPRRQADILKVEILNFKSIRCLELSFPPRNADQAGWKVLLGENGVGKSSVLQAIAMTLMGANFIRAAGIEPDRVLRKSRRAGYVRVTLSDASQPIEMSYTTNRFTFKNALGEELFLRGYGATRLLPRRPRPEEQEREKQVMWVANLFDPFTPLGDANHWIAGLDRGAFNSLALTFKDLLRLPEEAELDRVDGRVILEDLNGVEVTLDELSDGYQTVLALAADIIAGYPGQLRDYRYASGIVLIDEIGAHLHPRWRMEIVDSLRQAFPNVQFIASTHEPLCLRGLDVGEVAVMRREGGQIELLQDLPSPAGLRADQLLTSHFFGLHSTIDPTIDRQFQAYYELLAKPDRNPEEKQLLEDLKAKVDRHRVLGYTRRDQLVYEIIDEYLAQEQATIGRDGYLGLNKLRDETKERVKEIWRRVSLGRGGGE